jgi:hypothetical protein
VNNLRGFVRHGGIVAIDIGIGVDFAFCLCLGLGAMARAPGEPIFDFPLKPGLCGFPTTLRHIRSGSW